MGMRDELQSELAEAFSDPDGLGDAVKPFVGSRDSESGYNPGTGQVEGGEPLIYSGRGVFGSYVASDIDGSLILSTDVKLLALQNEVVQAGTEFTPAVGDTINGRRVINVAQDAAGATWTLQLRS